jgi:hypothetical protein
MACLTRPSIVRWNNLGAEGGAAIAEAIKSNDNLVELLLSGNKVNDESLRVVEARLEANRARHPAPIISRRSQTLPSISTMEPSVSRTQVSSSEGACVDRKGGLLQMQNSSIYRSGRGTLSGTNSPRSVDGGDGWMGSHHSPISSRSSPERPRRANALSASELSTTSVTTASKAAANHISSLSSSPYLPAHHHHPAPIIGGGPSAVHSVAASETSVSLEKWDKTMKERIVHLTAEVMEEKESYIRLEARYREEMAGRNDLAVAYRKLEAEHGALVQTAAYEADVKARLEEQVARLSREKIDAEGQCHRLADELSAMRNELDAAQRQAQRRVEEASMEVKSLERQLTELRRQYEDDKISWREKEMRLSNELRQMDEARLMAEERFASMQSQERERIEVEVRRARSDLELRMRECEEMRRDEENSRRMAEDELRRLRAEYEQKMREVDAACESKVNPPENAPSKISAISTGINPCTRQGAMRIKMKRGRIGPNRPTQWSKSDDGTREMAGTGSRGRGQAANE